MGFGVLFIHGMVFRICGYFMQIESENLEVIESALRITVDEWRLYDISLVRFVFSAWLGAATRMTLLLTQSQGVLAPPYFHPTIAL